MRRWGVVGEHGGWYSGTHPPAAGAEQRLLQLPDHGALERDFGPHERGASTGLAGINPKGWKRTCIPNQNELSDNGTNSRCPRQGVDACVQAWADSTKQDVVVDTTYCYTAGVAAGADCTKEDQANDRDKLQWSKDNATGQVTSYGYLDADGKTATKRLTGTTQTGGSNPTNWAYTYDDAGNRLTAKATNAATGAVTTDTALTYNAIGQITTTGYSYDGTGNLIAAPGETYTYNGAQQMTSSTKDGATTQYTYAGADMNKLLTQITGVVYGGDVARFPDSAAPPRPRRARAGP